LSKKALIVVMLLVVVGASLAGAQVYPVRLDQEWVESEAAALTPPSLVLADGGIQFPDGSVQSTAAVGGPPAPVPRTGQTTCYDATGAVTACGTGIGLGQDGDLQLGVTWPNPRFTDNGNGTVTDNLTGLVWLDDANCFGNQWWANALAEAAALFDGCTDCGGTDNDCDLSDGSVAGEWRLPNVRELQSLVHFGVSDPAIPNTSGTGQWSEGDPFSGVQTIPVYYSSTTSAILTDDAWAVRVYDGWVSYVVKSGDPGEGNLVWPVRGGQSTPPSVVLADGGIQFLDGSVQSTAAVGGPPAPVPRTGQTTCYDAAGAVTTCGTGIGLGQDGDLQLGVTWPNPRFTDNGNGTVTDNLTRLIWLDDADCFATQSWANALAKANALFDGCTDCGGTDDDCGLTDGSIAGQWRLPNVRELQSLVHYGVYNPAVPDTSGTGQWSEGDPFSGVQSAFYWSSATSANLTGGALVVNLNDGFVSHVVKGPGGRMWPVRGGQ
jgi:hypothetical protein